MKFISPDDWKFACTLRRVDSRRGFEVSKTRNIRERVRGTVDVFGEDNGSLSCTLDHLDLSYPRWWQRPVNNLDALHLCPIFLAVVEGRLAGSHCCLMSWQERPRRQKPLTYARPRRWQTLPSKQRALRDIRGADTQFPRHVNRAKWISANHARASTCPRSLVTWLFAGGIVSLKKKKKKRGREREREVGERK